MSRVFLSLLGTLCLWGAAPPSDGKGDEGSEQGAPNAEALARASEPARAAWTRLLDSAGANAAAPIQAFSLEADVRTRDGARRNDLRVMYRYLAPAFIRFALPGEQGTTKRETGRGPGEGQRAYWLREGDEVKELQGRDFTEDRRLVDEMLVVARNFLAFSNLSGLSLESLTLLPVPPPDLPEPWRLKPWWRKLTWLSLESPDFALLHPERRAERPGQRLYVVELGLDPEDGLPRVAVVREQPDPSGGPSASPLCFRLDRYSSRDGFLVPLEIVVHPLLETPAGPRFAVEPSQDITLLDIELRPTFTPEDFLPR